MKSFLRMVCIASLLAPQAMAQSASDAKVSFFEKRIRPILTQKCYRCHSAEATRVCGGLWVDTRASLLKGGESGPAIVPGHPEKSLLIKAVRYADRDLQMPPKSKLTRSQIADLELWIRQGAVDPRQGKAKIGKINFDLARKFWSFQSVLSPAIPAIEDQSRCNNAIDHFIQSRLQEKNLSSAAPASRRTLIRRVTFDLIGLPPTPGEIADFLADTSPVAFERVVDRLLSSPHYGEKWGRHWLDLVRYADTSGCNSDFPIPQAHRYRNYVIDAFNKDKPYDQFVREQIAGDLMPSSTVKQRHEQIIATGFLALSRRFGSLDDENHLTLEDCIEVMSQTMLGLSVNCARCHNHKFDPIPQRDYYAIYGILESTRIAFPGTEIYRWPRDLYPLVGTKEAEARGKSVLDQEVALDAEYRRLWLTWLNSDTGSAKNKARNAYVQQGKKRELLNKQRPKHPKAYAVLDGKPHDAYVHRKGDPTNPGELVPRGFLTILGGQTLPSNEQSSGRLQLAQWLTDEANPLTARVIVNRVWQYHFGRGLVATPNDFGIRGQRPSHPQLLDYLTGRFIAAGWSIKKLHKAILMSATYQQSSTNETVSPEIDPENQWLWKFNRRRLSAEEIRDSLLSVSGQLVRAKGGAHPFPPEAKWHYTQHKPFYAVYPSQLRSVYLMQQRIAKHPFFKIFDGADTNATTAVRSTSITPVQALYFMNNEWAHKQSEAWARLLVRAGSPTDRIQRAYQQVFGRPAETDEIRTGTEYLQKWRDSNTGLASYLRALWSSNEHLFVD